MKNKMKPIHPGEILKEELEELNINASHLAKILMVPPNRVTDIIKGKRSITADTALRLSRFFGTTAELWLNLQAAYDLKSIEKKSGKQIYNQIHPYFEAA
jgi:antitoxin HigA-1